MPTFSCAVAALAVAVIFYTWRGYHGFELRRQRTLRQRVAFMLWVMAGQAGPPPAILLLDDLEPLANPELVLRC